MNHKKRRIILLFSMLAFVLVATFTLFYSQGYIIDKGFNLSRRGGIYISTPMSDVQIFINNKEKKTTGMFNSALFMSNVKIGEYSILVAKAGFLPWAKTLQVEEGVVTEARAITVPESPRGEMIFKGKILNIWASPYEKLLLLQEEKNNYNLLNFYLPEKDIFLTPISSFTEQLLSFNNNISNLIWEKESLIFKSNKGIIKANFDLNNKTIKAFYFSSKTEDEVSDFTRYTKRGDEKIWWDPNTNEIFVDWLKDSEPPYYLSSELSVVIFQGNSHIKNVDFFPKRKDVVIMAIENGVYALEIDGRGGRLIYPIYKGKDPTFASLNEKDLIYIIDEGSLFKMFLK